jgi:polyhydroxybutyrate depolymerase
MGTGDPNVPYRGGPMSRRGITGIIAKRRMAKHGELPGEEIVAGAQETCADWALANGITGRPAIADLPATAGDLTVQRRTWMAPGCRSVTLYTIDDGGHGWPGGPQFLPARVIGPISQRLDATAILLTMTARETAAATGYRRLERGR